MISFWHFLNCFLNLWKVSHSSSTSPFSSCTNSSFCNYNFLAEDLVTVILADEAYNSWIVFATTFYWPLDLVIDGSILRILGFLFNAVFFNSLLSSCNWGITKCSFFNCSCSSNISLSLSSGTTSSYMVSINSVGYACIYSIGKIFVVALVSGFLGTFTTLGEKWIFLPFFFSDGSIESDGIFTKLSTGDFTSLSID